MPRKPTRLPDHFTSKEAEALVAAAPSYQIIIEGSSYREFLQLHRALLGPGLEGGN